MSDEIARRIAKQELERHGIRVDEIPRGEGKTADLLATDNESKYLIEAKDRNDNPAVDKRRQEHFAAGKMFINSDPVSYDDNVCKSLREARKQLNETHKEPGTFQLVWFHGAALDAEHKFRRIFKTFYGHSWLCPVEGGDSVHCLYFYFNLAHEMRDVEALILTFGNDIRVCLNEFAQRIDEFRDSELCQMYSGLGVVYDPKEMVASGEYIACTADMSRKDPQAMLDALEVQTGIRYRKCVRSAIRIFNLFM
jgi:hypothetical protein